MQQPILSYQELTRALAQQDEQLRAVYAAVESGKPVLVDLKALHALSAACTPAVATHGSVGGQTRWNAVRG